MDRVTDLLKTLIVVVPTMLIAVILFFIPEPTQLTTIAGIWIIGVLYSKKQWRIEIPGIGEIRVEEPTEKS